MGFGTRGYRIIAELGFLGTWTCQVLGLEMGGFP